MAAVWQEVKAADITVHDVFQPWQGPGRPDVILALEGLEGRVQRAAEIAETVQGVARAAEWKTQGLLGVWLEQ